MSRRSLCDRAKRTPPFRLPFQRQRIMAVLQFQPHPPHPPMIEISIGLLHPSFPLILANKINHRYKILFSLSFFLFFFYHSISEPARSCCGLAANPRPPRRTIDELSRFGQRGCWQRTRTRGRRWTRSLLPSLLWASSGPSRRGHVEGQTRASSSRLQGPSQVQVRVRRGRQTHEGFPRAERASRWERSGRGVPSSRARRQREKR